MLGAHGGDGGGKDPHRPWWKPSFGCKGSGSKKTPPPPRGTAKHLNLDAAVAKNGGPLPVYYDYKSKTFQPIGDYGAMYKSMLGSLIGSVPQYYDSWDDVPQSVMDHILQQMQESFDFQEYLALPKYHPTRKAALGAFRADCLSIYRQRKSKFKSAYFTERGGIDALDTLEAAPPAGMQLEEWGKLLSFYTRGTGSTRPRETRQTGPNKRWGLRGGDLSLWPMIERWPSIIIKRRRGHRPRGRTLGSQLIGYNLRKLCPNWMLREVDTHRIRHRHLQPSCSRKRLERDRAITADLGGLSGVSDPKISRMSCRSHTMDLRSTQSLGPLLAHLDLLPLPARLVPGM